MPPLPDSLGFSPLEYAPESLIHAPHFPYWLWLSAKYHHFALPAIANPTIFLGGLLGESKTDTFALVGEHARSFFAPFVTVAAGDSIEKMRAQITAAQLSYPLVAKPDIGRNGRGMKIVRSDEALMEHLARFRVGTRMVLQKYVKEEGEAGVFYVRKPSEPTGRITSLTLKYFPSVVGDGKSTLRELIMRDARAGNAKVARIYLTRNRAALARIIPEGERYPLVSVGNHIRGALFLDGANYITPAMTEAFDKISKDIKGFYFGRYDVRFANLSDLAEGKNFTIIEYNGASSEPTHVWDPRMKPLEVWKTLLAHWRMAFEIGAQQRARGVVPIPLRDILKANRAEIALIESYPDEE